MRQSQNQTVSLPDLAQAIEFDAVTGDESQPIGELVAQVYDYQNLMFESLAPEGVSADDEPWKGVLNFNSAVAKEYRKRALM